MAALTPINTLALECFDELADGGVSSWTRSGPFVVGFVDDAHAKGFLHEIDGVARHGQEVPLERLDDPQELAPMLSEAVTTAYRLDGQRFLEPAPFLHALAESVVARGGRLRTDADVVDVWGGPAPMVTLETGERLTAESVVIATGAWMPTLARRLGVKVPI